MLWISAVVTALSLGFIFVFLLLLGNALALSRMYASFSFSVASQLYVRIAIVATSSKALHINHEGLQVVRNRSNWVGITVVSSSPLFLA